MKTFRYFAVIACGFALLGCNANLPTLALSDKSQALLADERALDDRRCSLPVASHDQLADYAGPDFNSLWNRLRSGYQLGNIEHERIDGHLQWYQRHPTYFKRVTERGQRFLYHIVSELEARNMPMELALLPIVESAFDPFAYSHGSASGMWQFISATGRQYGLEQNWWYDGRRDAIASTDAALNFLSDMHRRFDGDWLLALASYNTGEGNVRRAIRKNERLGKPTDFWSLSLPSETRAYVPMLLALSKIVMAPEHYQVKLTPIANEPYFAAIDTGSQIDLAQAAEMAGVELSDLYQLNAGFNRWATAPEGPHRLLVPVAHAEQFRQQLAQLPASARVSWERYQVRPGDSLLAIASRHKTTVDVLRQHNNIRGNLIRQGQMLLIPRAALPADQYVHSASQRLQRTQSRAQGDSGSRKIDYRVKNGDSLWSIARAHDVEVGKLARWNGMAPRDLLRANQQLVIWTNKPQQVTASRARDSGVVRKVAYRVRNGDSLARIAGKFNLSINDIVSWNTIDKSQYIHPGQSLTLFVDVTRVN